MEGGTVSFLDLDSSLHRTKTFFSNMHSSGAVQGSGFDVISISCTPGARRMQ